MFDIFRYWYLRWLHVVSLIHTFVDTSNLIEYTALYNFKQAHACTTLTLSLSLSLGRDRKKCNWNFSFCCGPQWNTLRTQLLCHIRTTSYQILLSTVIYLDERGSLAVECAVIKRPMQSRSQSTVHGAKVISLLSFLFRSTEQCVRAAWARTQFYDITNNMDQMINDDMTWSNGKRPRDKTMQTKDKIPIYDNNHCTLLLGAWNNSNKTNNSSRAAESNDNFSRLSTLNFRRHTVSTHSAHATHILILNSTKTILLSIFLGFLLLLHSFHTIAHE